jgi:hypothetical protein
MKSQYMPMFTQGEIIVRNDLKYPDGVDEQGHLLVHPLGGGLQFSVAPHEVGRFEDVDPAEQIPVYSAGVFSLDGIEGDFEGWSDGSSWNGWENPCFSREVAEGILEASGYRWSYDPSADEFTIVASEEDGPEQFKGETIQLGDGGSVTAYFVGAGGWVWDKI